EGYPDRFDRRMDPTSGDLIEETILRPTVGRMRLPRALAATIGIERQIRPGLDAQVGLTDRRSMHLATLRVPGVSGAMTVDSAGSGRYRDVQLSLRRTWQNDQQLF